MSDVKRKEVCHLSIYYRYNFHYHILRWVEKLYICLILCQKIHKLNSILCCCGLNVIYFPIDCLFKILLPRVNCSVDIPLSFISTKSHVL